MSKFSLTALYLSDTGIKAVGARLLLAMPVDCVTNRHGDAIVRLSRKPPQQCNPSVRFSSRHLPVKNMSRICQTVNHPPFPAPNSWSAITAHHIITPNLPGTHVSQLHTCPFNSCGPRLSTCRMDTHAHGRCRFGAMRTSGSACICHGSPTRSVGQQSCTGTATSRIRSSSLYLFFIICFLFLRLKLATHIPGSC